MGAKAKKPVTIYIIDDQEGCVHEELSNPTDEEIMDAVRSCMDENDLDADEVVITQEVYKAVFKDSLVAL